MTLRPLMLPYEHGAWGFLLEPIAVGLLIAPSRAGALIAIGAVAAFLARHPLRLAVRDRVNQKRVPRTRVCEWLALGYGAIAVAAFLGAGARPLIPLIVAMPFVLFQFAADVRNRGRSLSAELSGALAAGWTAAAIVLAASRPSALAIALWGLLAARAVVSILYVRCSLRGERRAVMLTAHVAAVILAVALMRVVHAGAVLAMLVLLARALPIRALSARQIGVRELGYGMLAVLLIALI
jgi:hypothetical protein